MEESQIGLVWTESYGCCTFLLLTFSLAAFQLPNYFYSKQMDTGGDRCSPHQLSVQIQSMSSSKKILIRIPPEVPFQECMHFFPLIFNHEIDLESKAWVETNRKLSFTQKDCILCQQITFHPPDDNEFSPEGIGCSLLGWEEFFPSCLNWPRRLMSLCDCISVTWGSFFKGCIQLPVSQLNKVKKARERDKSNSLVIIEIMAIMVLMEAPVNIQNKRKTIGTVLEERWNHLHSLHQCFLTWQF